MAQQELGIPESGSFVKDNRGNIGVFQGTEHTELGASIRIRFPDHDRLLPLKRFQKLFTIFSPGDGESLPVEETEQDKIESQRKIIGAYIRKNKTYTPDSFYFSITKPELKTQFEIIVQEALQNGYVFRGDIRHPHAKGWRDKTSGILREIFREDFKVDPYSADSKIYS